MAVFGASNQLIAVGAIELAAVLLLLWQGKRLREHGKAMARAQTEAFRLARADALTGLTNLQGFAESVSKLMGAGAPVSVLLIDIENFKQFNGTHGLRMGDELLRAFADRLRGLSPDKSRLARVGADEFGWVLEAGVRQEVAEAAALKVMRALEEPLMAGGQSHGLRVNIGLARSPDHATSSESLIRSATSALDRVRLAGESWGWFDPAAEAAERARFALARDLREAIRLEHLEPWYQPVVNLASSAVVGMEILVRWRHPERGLLTPDVFIPLAEELGLAGAISQSLFRQLSRDSRHWPDHLTFAFNASPGQLRDLIALVQSPASIGAEPIEPSRIELEVTESALVQDLDVAREVIAALHAQGTRVTLDNFGVGSSSIFHLRALPFDKIKIDRRFVMDMDRDRRSAACVHAMVALGQSLGVEVAAEGVETAETASQLLSIGCPTAQGYYYSEPIPAPAVTELLRLQSRAA
jgi:diguanylate cyclase (GGDEF)-like protein